LLLLSFLNQNFNGKHPQPRTNNQKPTSNNHQSTSSTTPTAASLPPKNNNSNNYNIIHNVNDSSYTATTIVVALLALECNMVFFSLFRKKFDLYPATMKASKMARGCWAQVSSFLMPSW